MLTCTHSRNYIHSCLAAAPVASLSTDVGDLTFDLMMEALLSQPSVQRIGV